MGLQNSNRLGAEKNLQKLAVAVNRRLGSRNGVAQLGADLSDSRGALAS
jgi:hypothetical protein